MTKLLHSKGIWWFFLLLTIFIYFYGLGIPLLGPDEPRYAQVAREMYERGDWITPTLGGFNWFEKPALLYWLQIAFYHVLGVTEYAARLGPALFGLGTVAALYIVGRYAKNNDPRSTNNFANWMALIAASTLSLVAFSRGASFDIIVTFPLTASLAGFFVFLRTQGCDSRCGTIGLAAFYLFAGFAILAKGLIGIVFPFAIVALYFLLSRQWPTKRFLVSLVWGSVLMLAVAALWNLPMYLRHGWEFIDQFYVQHHFQRYTSNKYKHPQPFYFFFWVLPLMTLPWLPWFLVGVWRSIKAVFQLKVVETDGEKVRSGESETFSSTSQSPESPFQPSSHLPTFSPSPLLLFGLAWITVPLIFFSLSGSKLPGYILPTVPGTVLLTSVVIFELVQRSDRWRAAAFGIAFLTFIFVLGLVTFALPKYAETDSVKRLMETADAAGFAKNKVTTFRTLSHNSEYYAAGRLLRNEDGTQFRANDIAELMKTQSENEFPLLVLVRIEDLDKLTIPHRVLADNGEYAIVALTK